MTFKNLITSSSVAKSMIDEVWWQSDLNWCQEVVHKHTYISTDVGENITSHHLRDVKGNKDDIPAKCSHILVVNNQARRRVYYDLKQKNTALVDNMSLTQNT